MRLCKNCKWFIFRELGADACNYGIPYKRSKVTGWRWPTKNPPAAVYCREGRGHCKDEGKHHTRVWWKFWAER